MGGITHKMEEPLHRLQIESLLEDIESSDEPLESIHFLSLCNRFPRTYGISGTSVSQIR
jgi:hypothetical protein